MDIKQLYLDMSPYDRIKFLQWVFETDKLKYEYAGMIPEIRVFYNGELREEDLKRKEHG